MKKNMFKSLILTGVFAMSAVLLAEDAPIIVRTTVNKNLYDLSTAEKRFKEGDPTIVKLVPMTEEQLQITSTVSDANRLTWKAVKAQKDDYQYTLDSAADQAEKEEEKEKEGGDAAEKQEETPDTAGDAGNAGDVSFYVLSSASGLNFVFRSTSLENGKYEIILKPTTAGRFPGSEVHFMFEQSSHIWSTTLLGPSCMPLNSNPVANGFRPEHRRTADGAMLTRISLSWETVYKILGELPMVGGHPSVWEFSVFRWAKSGCSTLRSTPRDPDAQTYLFVPALSDGAIDGLKAEYARDGVDKFFYDDPKKGNPTKNYFGGVRGYTGDLHLWRERVGIEPKIAYPLSLAEYYLGVMPRRVPKPDLSDPEKTKEMNFRITEYMEEMTYYGKDIKDRAGSTALIDEMTRLDVGRYIDPAIGYWELQWEAIQRRVFSNLFLEDILKLK